MTRVFEPEDVLAFKLPGDPQLSPDGTKIAFVVRQIDAEQNRYQSSIWLHDIPTNRTRRFTNGRNGAFASSDHSPRWSPDGAEICFISDRSGKAQLWLMSASGGEAYQLTSAEPVSSPAWSPSGDEIAFTAKNPLTAEEAARSKDFRVIDTFRYRFNGQGYLDGRPAHVFAVSPRTQAVRQLTQSPWEDRTPFYSPDGKRIAFLSCRRDDWEYAPLGQLWVLTIGETEPRQVTGCEFAAGESDFTSDGCSLVTVGHANGMATGSTQSLWRISIDSQQTERMMPAFDRSNGCSAGSDQGSPGGSTGPFVCSDGSTLFIASDGGNSAIYRWRAGLDQPEHVVGHDGSVVFSMSASVDGRRIAFAAGSPTDTPDIYLFDGLAVTRITAMNDALLTEASVQPAERVLFPARDGTVLEGWLMKPVGFAAGQKYPLVFEIHGGPHSAYGNAFFHEFQCLAGDGFGVFYCNPRGSVGYGEGFARSITGDWCGIDASDLLDAAQYAADLDWVDSTRVGVTGGSQGGYFTNWLVGHTDMFRAAVTQRSMSNVYSKYGTADNGVTHDKVSMGGADLWTDEELLMERSPIRYAPNVRTPILILHSEEDYRCPIEQAEQWYAALKRLGNADVEFIRFIGENHELSRSGKPSNRVERLRRLTGWFKRYMQ